MSRLLIFVGILGFGSTAFGADAPSERAYKSHVFQNRAFSYKDNKIVFPGDTDPSCIAIFEKKSYSCKGSTTTTILNKKKNENNLNLDFNVSTTKEQQDLNFYTTVEESLIESQNVCRYDTMFTPLGQFTRVVELDCNLLTNNLCEVIFDVYRNPLLEPKDAKLDKELFKRFYEIVKSSEYQKSQKQKIEESYGSIFNVLNYKHGKNKLSVNEHKKKMEKFSNAINDNSLKITSMIDFIDAQGVTNFKEFELLIDKKYQTPGYFSRAYSACNPMYSQGMFKGQAQFKSSNKKETTDKI